MTRSKNLFATVFAALLVLFALSAPALAHHKDGHTKGGSQTKDHDGDADRDRGTSYTEDDDTNDGGTPNNVSDEGDNKHPSGKDRSVENGKNPNQGKSESDPDDDGRGPDRSNGGPDKPNGSGGVDKADQDGNNGCGNDDDFEDDNEGWCGGKPKDRSDESPDVDDIDHGSTPPGGCSTTDVGSATDGCDSSDDGDDVGSGVITQPGGGQNGPDVHTSNGKPGDSVQGVVLHNADGTGGAVAERGPLAAVLPFTGSSATGFVLVALGLILGGVAALRLRRHTVR